MHVFPFTVSLSQLTKASAGSCVAHARKKPIRHFHSDKGGFYEGEGLVAVAGMLLAALAAGQAQEQYLDVYVVQVKPEKRAEFDAVSRKIVAANRQNESDVWIAMETVYGQGERVSFISTRNGYGDAEKATGAFDEALQKSFGFTEHVCRSNNPHCKCFSFRRRDETHHNPRSGAGHRVCVLAGWSLPW